MAELSYEISLEGMPSRYTARYRSIMTDIGNEIIKRIRARTLKGIDANGKPFGEYADGSGRINLRDTGRMLDSLHIKSVSENGFELGVGAEYAKYVDGRFNFFALSAADVRYIERRIEDDFFDFLLDPKRRRAPSRKGV